MRMIPALRHERFDRAAVLAWMFLLLTMLAGAQPAPAPAPTATFDIVFSDSKIETIINYINSAQPVKVALFGKTAGERASIAAEGITLEDAMGQLSRQKGWVYWKLDEGGYGLADRAYFEQEVLPKRFERKVFQPKYLKASELQKAVQDLLTKGAANGSAISDDRTNKLIVDDLPVVLERIERLLREIDVQLVTRVFRIRHADVDAIAQKLENYKSGPGTIEVDVKTHQIIVTDLFPNIKKMELLIDILDVGPEIVLYDVNNIGIDGKDLETLQKIIDTIRTKDLLFEVNAKQGVFILEDVPSVHERVEQILETFDRPVKQVQIQGEIVQTTLDRNFALGVDRFAYSGNLLQSIADGSIPGPIGAATGDLALPNLGFQDLAGEFPVFDFAGSTITGQFLNKHVLAVASAVFSDVNTNILLQPNLLVKNQESSRVFVGSETPFLTTFFNDNSVGGGSTRSETQQRIPDGLEFEITPSISNTFLIELEIRINNDKAFQAGENQGITLIGRDRQNIETTLQIPSGQTRVIGGLITNSQTDTTKGLPFISKIPILGYLFGKKSNADKRTNLMMFITPTIVEDSVPRPSGTLGRRGRMVSDYERASEEAALSPEQRARLEAEIERLRNEMGGPELSSNPEDEMNALELIREALPEDERSGAANPLEGSNYTPASTPGTGVSINTATPAPEPPRQPGRRGAQGGGRNPNAPGGGPRGQGQPGGQPRVTPVPQQGGGVQPPPPRLETGY